MLRLFYLFGILLIGLRASPQFTMIHSVRLNHTWFSCDANKNIFAISEGKFLKYSPPYNSSLSFDLEKNGLPSYIDINNLNEIVLFYRNSRKIILLDSTLNLLIRPFFLDEIGMDEISMVFSSKDGGLWFFNFLNNSLTKLNKNFIPDVRSLSLNPYFQPPNIPNFIATFEGKIYLNVPSNGILVLGANGEYNTAIPLQGLLDFQVDGKIIYFYRDNIIYCFNIKTLKTKKIYIPDEPGIINAYFHQKQLIILTKEGFSIYRHEINPSENY